jgi:hypothetical protein
MSRLSLNPVWCVLALFAGGCAWFASSNGQVAQSTVAREAQDLSCKKFLARFQAGAGEGMTCQASKERAEAENPTCPLTFECGRNRLDGGAE